MKKFKKAAASVGYELWWDRYLGLWAATKENCQTIYFSSSEIRAIGIEKMTSILADYAKEDIRSSY